MIALQLEVVPEQDELIVGRHFPPVQDGDERAFLSAPLLVRVDQGMQHQMPPEEWSHFVELAELSHHRQAEIDFRQHVRVGNGSRSLGVELGKPQCCFLVKEGIHT